MDVYDDAHFGFDVSFEGDGNFVAFDLRELVFLLVNPLNDSAYVNEDVVGLDFGAQSLVV